MSSSRLRQLRPDDAERVAALFHQAYGDARPLDAEEIRTWLRNEEFEPDWLQVLEEDGTVVGYGDIWFHPDEIALDVAAPGRWTPFFEWAEAEARERGRPRVRVSPPAGHEVASIAEARGYRPWRSSFAMEVDLDSRPADAAPDGLFVAHVHPADEEALRAQLNDAFARRPVLAHGYTVELPRVLPPCPRLRPNAVAARVGWPRARRIRACLPRAKRRHDRWAGSGRSAFGPRGAAAGWAGPLLRHAFRELYDRGLTRIGLGVDADNPTGALGLYERAGMHKVGQVDNWVLDL